jgi:hypothetical protein
MTATVFIKQLLLCLISLHVELTGHSELQKLKFVVGRPVVPVKVNSKMH